MASEYANARLESIEMLALQRGQSIDIAELTEIENRTANLNNAHGMPPTIGCEVEVKWSSLHPALAHKYFGEQDEYGRFEHRFMELPADKRKELSQLYRRIDTTALPAYEKTVSAGVPKGNDAYWEFANSPTYSWQALAAEVGILMDSGLIPTGHEHSLHITLGDVDPIGGGMALVLSGLELVHVSSSRITASTLGNRIGIDSGWARKGDDGIRRRPASEIALGHEVATELRTLTVSSTKNAAIILSDAQALTTVLQAFRKRRSDDSPIVQELAGLWPEYRDLLNDLWSRSELPAEGWGKPYLQPNNWNKWSAVIGSRNDEGSLAYQAIEQIDNITATARFVVASCLAV
ncbi:MAG: hypothetical protein ABI354_01545 [Candidatus Saccharimonadales bacterium]